MFKPVSQILKEARDYMDVKGWCRGRFENTDGEVCLMGAIVKSQLPNTSSIAHGCLDINTIVGFSALQRQLGKDGITQGISVFNDDPATTYEDIELLWKKAIHTAEEIELSAT